ncbi:tRNA epoxyqueuosine(34) reductase QueG [candidate division KSB1 bacterium]|nr:MAG: tRNA epoxyqueuosine(34) reductase QueG [candidate division KSB1 bacterium]
MLSSLLSKRIKEKALSLGFFRTGIARAELLDAAHLDEWLARGYHGNMQYMQQRRDLALNPTALLADARSIIVCAMNYYTPYDSTTAPGRGRISRYGWGDDYHEVLRPRLGALLAYIQDIIPHAQGRVFVDSGPLMEKAWAVRAGIGWQGKHSIVITRDHGSWFFIGAIIVDVELSYDVPFSADHCGGCRKCIEACPTRAIAEPYVVDAQRCISYLTVELKHDKPYPEALKARVGLQIFGCDICQNVCPWNRFAKSTNEPAFQPYPQHIDPDLGDLLRMTREEFQQKYRHSPIKRTKLEGLQRNVRMALEKSVER